MESGSNLPFEVGQLAEARSFQKGYRGAWFRCKIINISNSKGSVQLEYYDFPDEKLKWTRLYQKPIYHPGKGKEKHRELVLRPAYPPIYNQKQMCDVNLNSQVAVDVSDSWKVGDLVDWWTTGCYWSGKIMELFGNDQAKFQLKPHPFGEGLVDYICLKDVRPSLDWSPENGWTLPSQEDNLGHNCARLIKPMSQVTGEPLLQPMDIDAPSQEAEADQGITGSSVGLSFSSPASSSTSLGIGSKTIFPDTDSGQSEPPPKAAGKNDNSINPPKKCRAGEGVTLHSSRSDTLEAAVLDLEVYLNKVKLLRRMLKHGISSPNALLPQWKFLEPSDSSQNPN